MLSNPVWVGERGNAELTEDAGRRRSLTPSARARDAMQTPLQSESRQSGSATTTLAGNTLTCNRH